MAHYLQKYQRKVNKLQHWRGSQAEMPPGAAPVLEFHFLTHGTAT